MRSKVLAASAVVAIAAGALFAYIYWVPAEVADPTYGDLHHIYMFHAGGDEIWHKSTKGIGPITGLDGKVLPSTPDAAHPGCLNVFVKLIPGVNQGIQWTTADKEKDTPVISSASQNLRVIACHDAIPEYESIDN
jgi:hypothetical protein